MKKKILSGTGLILLAVLFLLLNVFLGQLTDWRLDLTEQKLYTLSEGSLTVLKDIKEPIRLRYFFSEKASQNIPEIRNFATRVKDLLVTLVERSAGKIKFELIDPEPFSENEDMATQFGLQGIPLSTPGDSLYHGLVLTNSLDGQEVIPFFMPDKEETLEYQLLSAIHKLNHPEKPVLGVLTQFQIGGAQNRETGEMTRPWAILEQLGQFFEVKPLDPTLLSIDKSVHTLLLIGPEKLSPETLYAIDQYALRGGNVVLFLDPFSEQQNPAELSSNKAESENSFLTHLLAAWGVEYKSSKVVADYPLSLNVRVPNQDTPVRHVAVLGYGQEQMNRNEPVVANLNKMHLSTVGTLFPIKDSSVKFTWLVKSSQEAMLLEKERLKVVNDPSVLLLDYKPDNTVYTLAAKVDGPIKTAFPKGAPGGEFVKSSHLEKSTGSFHAIIVADTDLLLDRMWIFYQNFFGQSLPAVTANNGDFLLNAVTQMSAGDALMSIRGRGKYARPFLKVKALQDEAALVYQDKERELKRRLEETEYQLQELQKARVNTESMVLTQDQEKALQTFMQSKVNIRKELRSVQHGLNQQVESLDTWLKLINIGLIPLIVSIVALGVVWQRRRRRVAFTRHP